MENDESDPKAAPESRGGLNALQILARRWPFLAVGLVIGAVIGVLIHSTSPPLYQSSAQVLVVKKRTEFIKEGDVRMGAVEDYVATQVTLIKSEKIRLAAAREARQARSSTLPGDDRTLAEVIAAGLTVSRDKDATSATIGSGVLNLTFRGADPEDCRVILDAVIRAHRDELFNIYEKATKEKVAALGHMMEAIRTKRDKAGQERITSLLELRTITTEEVSAIRMRVSAHREQTRRLETELLNLNDQLELIKKAGPTQQDRQLILAQLTAQFRPGVTASPAVADPIGLVAELRSLEVKRGDLIRAGFGKDHPRLLAIDTQIASVKLDLARPTPTNDTKADELGAYQKWVEQKKETTDKLLKQLYKQMEDDEKNLKAAGGLQDRADALSAQILQFDSELKRLESEKMTTEATMTAGGYSAEEITPPGGGRRIAPVLTRSLLTGLAIGALLGIMMMVLAEMSDKSFRSAAEIRQRLGLAVVGHIPFIRIETAADDGTSAKLDPVLVAAIRPKSSEAEAYRGLRTQLNFITQGGGHQVIQVTSPTPGDGKSTLAANLAISMAQAGKKTALIDCDFRKPRVHKLFAVASSETGLAGVVAGTGTLREAIIPSGVPNLDLLPCGSRPASPAELLSSPQLQQILTQLREQYDYVIVDTPPLLAVTDPAIVAPRVDGVLIVFRMSKRARPTAERAREVLAGVGANILGVVVNSTNFGNRGYGYAYAYGYGYEYRYKYSDNYQDDQDAK